MTTFSQTSDPVELQKIAHQLRLDVLEMLHLAGSGHIGWPFGMADIFAALYFSFLNTTPENPTNPDRDYCLLSNGHICPIYYATLARRGFFPAEELQHLRKIDSLLQWHPKLGIPGVENSSWPLGHGLSQAVWIALTLKIDAKKNRVVCCMSDGEHQEWQTWEAVMSAHKWWLSNLIAIMDYNNLQIEGTTDEIMPLGNLAEKYRAFGWEVKEIDGHNFTEILEALDLADAAEKPTMIVAKTTLGKWVSFMENNWAYHDWAGKPGDYGKALAELSK
jgi:transketolase